MMHRVWGAPSVEIHHRFYIIKYSHGFDDYKILAPRRRGPCKFTKVLNECGEDVTKEVKQFMGPSHNFHGIPTTVDMLGYSELTFVNEMCEGEDGCSTFKTGETIVV